MITLPSDVKNVLVAPLNWGLGHACRSIPLIQFLIQQDKKVFIASDGEALVLLKKEFPNQSFITLPAYNVRYSSTHLYRALLSNGPRILSAIKRENKRVKDIIKENNIDYIISDSRFGIYHPRVCSVLVSHQLQIIVKNKLLKLFLNKVNTYFFKNFNECWIPDYKERTLSGQLSLNSKVQNKKFIGPQSSLILKKANIKYDLAIILSGPEPARTKLEKNLFEAIDLENLKIILVRGTTHTNNIDYTRAWEIIDLANRQMINEILLSSRCVISRSGYTSIMDYEKLKTKAIFIPTPGQVEQEYLATRFINHERYKVIEEHKLSRINSKIEKVLKSPDSL